MVAKRTAQDAPPVDYIGEMTVALSAKSIPRCFRPFEIEGLVGLYHIDEARKRRITKIAARLPEMQARKAMLEILWAMPSDDRPFQVAPGLNLGPFLQDTLLEEAERRGMVKITQEPYEGDTVRWYRPIKMDEAMATPDREDVLAYLRRTPSNLSDWLTPTNLNALYLFLYGQFISEEMMRLLPPEDRIILRNPPPAALVERMKAEPADEKAQEEAEIKAEADREVEPAAEAEPKQETTCEVYKARQECARYRWLQAQEAATEV